MTWLALLTSVLLLNTAVLLWAFAHYGFPRCDWCKRHYWYRSSTSKFPFVFCSYKCNYWDMRDFLATKMGIDIGEVEQYLTGHGWVHPDQIKEAK